MTNAQIIITLFAFSALCFIGAGISNYMAKRTRAKRKEG